jgi:hypothetical protein
MKILLTIVLAVALSTAFVPVLPAHAGEKPMAPAFDRELVPTEEDQKRNEYKDGASEDEKDDREEERSTHHHAYAPVHGKIHIQLDGDEDGGDGDGDVDGGGDAD